MNQNQQNTAATILRRLSPKDFVAFGVNDIAYVKPVTVNGAAAFAIHAADGRPLAVAQDLQVALATVRQHEMEPLTLH